MANFERIIGLNCFFVKNAVQTLEIKTADKLDIYDPDSRQLLLECREPNIGALTKVARIFGGRHDKGTEFDIMAGIPGSQQQVLRVSRGSSTLSFGPPALNIFDASDLPVGLLKKKNLAFGSKFDFTSKKDDERFRLVFKKQRFGGCHIFHEDKMVAKISGSDAPFYKEGKFAYAFYIDDEVASNSKMRQVLLAVAMVQHRMAV